MNDKIVLGLILLIATIFIGWLGGAICILAGLILGIVLIAIGATESSKTQPSIIEKKQEDRRCPNCGRVIPLDARICPYCTKKFW